MLLREALMRAEAVLSAYAPGSGSLKALNAHDPEQESFVFRAALVPSGSVIAKVAAPGRLAAQFARLQASHPRLRTGLYRVPEPYSYNAESGVLLMEDAWGMAAESIWRNDRAGPARVTAAAGGWLARYHGLTAARHVFNPDPHLNWLRKSLVAHDDGQRHIPDYAQLVAHLPALERLAEAARKATSLRAITHRDFHLRNLLIRKQGRTYGIDMENATRDEAMRDLLFFLFDTARCTPDLPSLSDMRRTAAGLRRAYGHSLADPAARLFFQHSFALNHWAGLDEDVTGLSQGKRRSLQIAQTLLTCDDLLADPPDEESAASPPPI
jgi:aminoglycoside/choline kinase family phosphotransferase